MRAYSENCASCKERKVYVQMTLQEAEVVVAGLIAASLEGLAFVMRSALAREIGRPPHEDGPRG